MRGKGKRNISTLTINKEAERRICGLRPKAQIENRKVSAILFAARGDKYLMQRIRNGDGGFTFVSVLTRQ
jgi:hypothetical protein